MQQQRWAEVSVDKWMLQGLACGERGNVEVDVVVVVKGEQIILEEKQVLVLFIVP